MTQPRCNICGSTQFDTYRGRPHERCAGCGAKARHRVVFDIYSRLLKPRAEEVRLLHFAPEACLHGTLSSWFGRGYLPADAEPERYPHAEALRLFLPDGLQIFPDGFFGAIIHNHVLEHIPGRYLDHLRGMLRLVRPGGRMIFTIPGPHMDRETEEFGELLETDAERLEKFLQEDHFKIFGADFIPSLQELPGCRFVEEDIGDDRRAELSVRPGKVSVFVLEKL